jgi:hypothetical protein
MSYNQQRGLNNGEGEYNKYNNSSSGDAAVAVAAVNVGVGSSQQQQEFVSPSLCIPRTHANIRKERLFATFRSLGLGWIGRIDIVEKTDESTGAPFIRVFIHFTKWFQNAQTRKFLERLETQKSANIVYDEPWFWKVTKSFVPAPPMPAPQQKQQQSSRFPKPRIDFDGASTRVKEAAAVAEVVVVVIGSEMATAASKTPSSNPNGTNAVSGKGKQIAKRMGYESGKGLGKKADGRIVPVQVIKNIGKNGVGLGCGRRPVAVAPPALETSADYWTIQAHDALPDALKVATAAQQPEQRLSVSVSPPKLERRLFCDKEDVIASVASAPAKASSHDASMAAHAIWQSTLSRST